MLVRRSKHRTCLILQANGPSLARRPPVRPWTRPQFRGLRSVVLDRIGFPTDMDCIGHAEGPSATFLRAPRNEPVGLSVLEFRE
jgi:hypothetical protein